MFLPMLSAWQWLVLGLVPPAITALYFLKLRRQPLAVPSTLLWRRTIEDLHVNSFWQRLRQSLLLYLQLLFVTFIILTLLRAALGDASRTFKPGDLADRQLGQHVGD